VSNRSYKIRGHNSGNALPDIGSRLKFYLEKLATKVANLGELVFWRRV